MALSGTNLDQLEAELETELARVTHAADLELMRRDWLGKEGTFKRLLREVGALPSEERPQIASRLNALKSKLEEFLRAKTDELGASEITARLEGEYLDLSLPGKFPGRGVLHPITRIERKVTRALKPFGLRVVHGPEIETDYFCFDSLNIPKHHPARDMQDTFYTNTGHLLRTHTTSVQARTLKQGGLPVKVLSPGKAYRNETIDASHSAMFHQYELIWIDKGLTLANLMAMLALVAKEVYGKRVKIRFKPKYYPYTEPSIGLDVACSLCKGEGCSFCGGAGWATVVGSGMVHKNVLVEFGYNPAEVSGMAFGFGTSRLASQEFSLPRLKMIYGNDLRVFKSL